ncbi:MAG: nickel-responsive transcriptional regulator NikR [Candidatus Cloacimonetes bacterium]|nr:nickel-responsive transcriptional regulator NikR [Candidatus Cloacimonadota bacterium]MCF7814524.1 nickel-responsive transcriptional regulator NikR [Candidatus Cloacimonadota bacterium]MCF7867684.1 nickel-responsive transcriptional regulator NikR [Candidatus Cloacimonadota bacterium]MCF7883518.1 nickel-responsive transcriptional regulator NikR [Candidatus Cloacimonadota bacterium]
MSDLVRFGVSLNSELLKKFDEHIKQHSYTNRSNAIADIIRDKLIEDEWTSNEIVTGVITMVFDHHQRELTNNLTNIQHDHHELIISSQHIHLDHDNCFEIIVVKGRANELTVLCNKLKAAKGVKHAKLSLATTGEKI